MEVSRYAPGQFAWIDLATSDLTAASRFYARLLGWEIDEVSDPAPGAYALCHMHGAPVAGLVQAATPPQPRLWTSYIAVDDADRTEAAVKRAGGRVLIAARDVGEAGRMALVADPAGASFGLWQARGHVGAGRVNEPGALCWNELQASDVSEAVAFYSQVFDWNVRNVDAGGLPYVVFSMGGRDNAGMADAATLTTATGRDLPPHWTVYFAVDDTDATAAKAAELGGAVAAGPFDYGGTGRAAVLADPQGYRFSVMTMAPDVD